MTLRARRAIRALLGAVAAVATSVAVAPAFAAAPADPEKLPITSSGSGDAGITGGAGGTLARMGIGLLVVLGIIFAVWYVLKRVRSSRYPETDSRGSAMIDVLSTTPLGPNRNLHLVRVGDELIVIGATDHSVNAVARIEADQTELFLSDLTAPDARGAFTPSSGSKRNDARFRAPEAPTADTAVLDRLRALTTRR
jgi:flagellar biosynthetic protein FliO